ncbi:MULTISPECIES: DHH family phosphoesterase [Dethiosulfovibrio]|nr:MULTISPECIES: bifunctional oligoribonuclease/PAP phosphatase NrnA [Dethiosulfovibrio]MCF4113604.1 bifunctional oligoribonuclease/PAP phosphatase NrnA [Dethiosulfovibrio russensis]MCF4144229.1 bifunctional oligoribonuclease/PAP phosphatase NrnA [Dethiosulfovibrio acidaminovorans]
MSRVTMENENKARLISTLKDSGSWILISHVKPDGDTLGSASALFKIGLSLGKDVRWYGKDPFPERYRFLFASDRYESVQSMPDIPENSVVVALDVSTLDRGIEGMSKGEKLVVIDHHGDNARFGDINLIEDVSSVGEMIYCLAGDMNVAISADMAEAIYVAIATDTGGMTFSNTGGKTLRIVADLLDCGLPLQRVVEMLYHNDTVERLHLWGRAYERVVRLDGLCYSWLYDVDFEETHTDQDDTESLVNSLMKIKDTKVAVLFVENDKDVKVSLRSDGSLSVREIAHLWNGGGHPCASGCRLTGPMDEVIARVLDSIYKR